MQFAKTPTTYTAFLSVRKWPFSLTGCQTYGQKHEF